METRRIRFRWSPAYNMYTLTKLCNKFKEKGVVLHRDRVRVDFMCVFISENISFID